MSESKHTPGPYRHWRGPEDGNREWAEEYDALVGPDFLCVLTEPEDRTWYRDGADVVVRLNQQHETITDLLEALKAVRSRILPYDGDALSEARRKEVDALISAAIAKATGADK